jgi:hypothetical protein
MGVRAAVDVDERVLRPLTWRAGVEEEAGEQVELVVSPVRLLSGERLADALRGAVLEGKVMLLDRDLSFDDFDGLTFPLCSRPTVSLAE